MPNFTRSCSVPRFGLSVFCVDDFPDPEIISAGGQQVRVHPFRVGDPHDLRRRVRMLESGSRRKVAAVFVQLHDLHLVVVLLAMVEGSAGVVEGSAGV